MPSDRRAFSVMAKPVGSACNLRCSYCYYLPNQGVSSAGSVNQGVRSAGSVAGMTDQVLESFIEQYIAASPGPEVSFVWHGGEPTLAGLDFYQRVIDLQKRYLPPSWVAWNNLQTNGVLLNDHWCEFLAKNSFDVGVSIDGTPAIHDGFRRSAAGRPSYSRVAEGIKRLQSHGVQPDLLCTITSATAEEPREVYHHLRGFGTGWIQFIPIVAHVDGKLTPDSVTAPAYGRFLCEVFDEWVGKDLGRLNVQFFAETSRTLGGGAPGLCWLAKTCGRAVVVEADGSVYSCDHFVNDDHRLGSIITDTMESLVNSVNQAGFGQRKSALPTRCQECPWLNLCHGGCPKDRGTDGVNLLCEGLVQFFTYAVPQLTRVIELARAGRDASAIMTSLRTRISGERPMVR